MRLCHSSDRCLPVLFPSSILLSFLSVCPPTVWPAESDARYGGFDFRAAHAKAEDDLKELLDNNESLVRGLLFLLSFCRDPLLP